MMHPMVWLMAFGQPVAADPASLLDELERLTSTVRVLYVAAHPDDENTRLLAYLTRGRRVDAAYLSLTRGGGGQNRIGDEQGGALSLIRTEELLAARRIDGARQFFTRARDFGYSKSAEETLRIWDRDEVVHDAVEVIRRFRPDVIVTRFRTEGRTHGHHLASARVARMAFERAADPGFETGHPPWRAHRLVLNVPRWRRSDEPITGPRTEVGGYAPLLGLSFPEIAAASRSMHKSQAFGMAPNRGAVQEVFEAVAGAPIPTDGDWLAGVPPTWVRFEGGAAVDAALAEVRSDFGFDPAASVPKLLRVEGALAQLEDSPRVADARGRLAEIIWAASGGFLRVSAREPEAVAGQSVALQLQAEQRGGAAVRLEVTAVRLDGRPTPVSTQRLVPGRWAPVDFEVQVPEGPPTTPFWLLQPPRAGTYAVSESVSPVLPRTPPALAFVVDVRVDGRPLRLRRPAVYVWVDRTRGERSRPVVRVPEATATPPADVVWTRPGADASLRFDLAGTSLPSAVHPVVPAGWTAPPAVTVVRPGPIEFAVRAPPGAAPADVTLRGSEGPLAARRHVDYDHIPPTILLSPASARVVPSEGASEALRIGYVMGAGDAVPEHLRALGAEVESLDDAALRSGAFGDYDSIVCGVRAFNVRDELVRARTALFAWVERGGRLVVQYNTNNWLDPLPVDVGPYPIRIDRTRVTDETAPVERLAPDHPLLRRPHAISDADFEGWVQERGLYFAAEWDERWQPLLSMSDPGEAPTEGALLVAEHGRGEVVVTGLSFFRQLPAGVPGAARLLLNLVTPEPRRRSR
jgi:LmbE family N-acetylglucosaminyl deacetylase